MEQVGIGGEEEGREVKRGGGGGRWLEEEGKKVEHLGRGGEEEGRRSRGV